ncbi:MAG: hypothetical protein KGO82_08455 [Bacteroidota bacterium]|nr:hypothetical protein [Bacteroidota bacterium]
MDKFIIGNNEMGPEKHIWYITHLLSPQAIIAVHNGHVDFKAGTYYQQFDFEGEQYTLQIHFMFSRSLGDGEAQAAEAASMLKKSWRWYRAYMEWEDNQ